MTGDPRLANTFSVIPVNPSRAPDIDAKAGSALAEWLAGAEAQALIAAYGADRHGRPLFLVASA